MDGFHRQCSVPEYDPTIDQPGMFASVTGRIVCDRVTVTVVAFAPTERSRTMKTVMTTAVKGAAR